MTIFYKQLPDRKPEGFISTGKENRDVDTMLQAFCATDQQLDLYIAPTNGSVNYQQIIERFCLPDSVRVHYTDGVIPYLLAQKVARKSCVVICCMDFPYTVGLTTLVEAFALGIPVICSRNPNFEIGYRQRRNRNTVAMMSEVDQCHSSHSRPSRRSPKNGRQRPKAGRKTFQFGNLFP